MVRNCLLCLVALLVGACIGEPVDDPPVDLAGRSQAVESAIAFPLRAEGRYIVDANFRRVKLKSVNWYGPHVERQVVAGLEYQPMDKLVSLITEWGFNSVRLPFSNLMIHDTRPVPSHYLTANPELMGLTPLQVFDRTVEALTRAGIIVILNNHTTFSEWCCGFDYNGLWYHTGSSFAYNQTTEMWENDWIAMVERYRSNPWVAGADLRNEVRTMRFNDTHLPESPNWGWRNHNDWHMASRNLGNRITRVHPGMLVIVEGINWWGAIPILGSGERPHLKPVRDLPVHLRLSDRLVYAAHNYAFVGPRHNGDDNTSAGNIKYGQMDAPTLRATLDDEWGFVTEAERYYTAPVWVSEFGVGRGDPSPDDREWFRRFVDYLIEKDLDFAYWPLNDEGYGLVSSDWSRTLKDDWRYEHLARLLKHSGRQGEVRVPHFADLNIQHGDDNQSPLDDDWLGGAHKGTCADGYRLVGMSRDQRALCSDVGTGTLGRVHGPRSVQAVWESSERKHVNHDWAGGFTKYECPLDHYAAGFTKHWWGTSGLLCLPANRPLGNTCRTLWFDRGDNRASTRGGDFARGSYKGQCSDREYVAGFAQRDGNASALLCCEAETEIVLKNRHTGQCLDVSGWHMENHTPVISWDCHGGNNQKWLYDAESGMLRSKHDTRYCLDTQTPIREGGGTILWECNGGPAQRFDLTLDGTIRVRAHPQLVVDVPGAGRTQLVSWTFHGGNNQRWDAIR